MTVLFTVDDAAAAAQAERVRTVRREWDVIIVPHGGDALVSADVVVSSDVELLARIEHHAARLLLADSIPAPHTVWPIDAFLLPPVGDELLCDIIDALAAAAGAARVHTRRRLTGT